MLDLYPPLLIGQYIPHRFNGNVEQFIKHNSIQLARSVLLPLEKLYYQGVGYHFCCCSIYLDPVSRGVFNCNALYRNALFAERCGVSGINLHLP